MSGTAMVWGASGGIGRATVALLAEKGWTVVALSRHPDNLADLTEHRMAVDPADEFAVQQAVMECAQRVDPVTLWVYSAGDITAALVADLDASAWRRILDANLTGAFTATHHSLPLLEEDAHLLYLGAVSERLRLPGLSAYAAAKAGLEAFATALAKEERKRRVTVLRPAAVETPLWEKVPMRLPKGALAPAAVAERIYAAYEGGETGQVDL